MYKKRVMPLLLAGALCVMPVRAHETSWLQLLFYFFGTLASISVISSQMAYLYILKKNNNVQNNNVQNLEETRNRNELNKAMLELSKFNLDGTKINIVSRAHKLSKDQITSIGLSEPTLKMISNTGKI